MAIFIHQNKTPRKGARPNRSRIALIVLAVIQLPVTLIVLALGLLLFSSIQTQMMPTRALENIGFVVTARDTYNSILAFRFPVDHWLGLDEDLPSAFLDIKQENYRALEYASLYDQGVITNRIDGEMIRRDLFVKADLRLEGEEILPVKIRLKGDRGIHWQHPEAWSFRVEVRGERSAFGMKTFSLQKPITRNYIYEWFFHKVLKREGLIGLRYDFIKLYVNGKSQGIYAVEEHFDKLLLENNNRREAPILRFTEIGVTEDKDWFQMTVSPYGKKRWMKKDPEMLRQATNLLEDFQYGRRTVGEVFDVELLGRYFALVDLLDSFHGGLAKSVKFYYNPINKKIEPIGFDAHFYGRKFPVLTAELSDFRSANGYADPAYYNRLFGPDIHNKVMFYESYIRELERMSRPEYLDELFAEIDPALDATLDAMYAEIPWHDFFSGHPLTSGATFLFYFSKDKFYDRQHFIRKRLYPVAAVVAYIEDVSNERIVLQLANAQKLPLDILEVVHDGILYRPANRTLVNEKPRYAPMNFEQHEFVAVGPRPPEEKLKKQAKLVTPKRLESAVRYRVPGTSESREHTLFGWQPSVLHSADTVPYNRYMQFEARRFLEVDESERTIQIKPGYWKITRDIVIPEGYTLTGLPGTVLDLLEGTRLVTYSPVNFTGTELDPIRITSSDKTGKGIVVLEAAERSELNYVHFRNLALAEGESWALPSVVTFHRSDVDIRNCFFGENQSEDALNIIRSNFTISNSVFESTFGDAFDSDFSDGRVDESVFKNIGNDAIDVSGSTITVRNVNVLGAGDKGISVGEKSRLEAEFVTISGANFGVAVKDKSYFEGMTLAIKNSNVGITLFQKKPEYGPASAALWRTSLSDVDESHWLEEGSSLSWEDSPVAPNKVGLKQVLYPDEYENAEVQTSEPAVQ